jgi:hypothetical protein
VRENRAVYEDALHRMPFPYRVEIRHIMGINPRQGLTHIAENIISRVVSITGEVMAAKK